MLIPGVIYLTHTLNSTVFFLGGGFLVYGLIQLYHLLISVKKSAKIKDSEAQHNTRQISEKVKESIGPIGKHHLTVISQTNKDECY